MRKIKKYILVLISILFIIAFCTKSVHAITCELKIEDNDNSNGFIEKDGQLYYVITISSKTFGGTLSSIKFKLHYDEEYLEMVQLENSELDLGEKGKYADKPYIIEYDDWDVTYTERSNVYLGRKMDEDRTLMTIEENEIDLIKICFKVRDNVQEKRLVYIDTQDDSTQILYAYSNQETRYITNGVPMNENGSDAPDINGDDNNKDENENGSDDPDINGDDNNKDENENGSDDPGINGSDNNKNENGSDNPEINDSDNNKNENGSDNPEINGSDNNKNKNNGANHQKDNQEQSYSYKNYESKENKSPKILPQTGNSTTILLVIVLIVAISIILWIKLRKTKI